MFGWIEFKKEDHERNVELLHNVKRDLCELIERMSKTYSERKHDDPYMFDERRGRYDRRDGMGGENMNQRSGYRHSQEMDYPPYREEHFDNRYNY